MTGAADPARMWLVATRGGCEVSVEPPQLRVDGVLRCGADDLIDWHNGALSTAAALRTGAFAVEGPRWLLRVLTSWGRLSPFVGVRPVADSRAMAAAG